ncbi:MAG: DUF4350 domain-containing protein [Pseudonocardiales bacterium]
MTAPPATPVTQPSGTAASGRTAAEIWRVVRLPLVVLVVVVIGGTVLGVSRGRHPRGSLDPRAVDPAGSRALAVLLDHRGVPVHRVRGVTAAVDHAGERSTVFVAFPDYEESAVLQKLQDLPHGVRLVVLDPTDRALNQLTAEISVTDFTPVKRRDPGCGLAAAATAGDADLGGSAYTLLNPDVGSRCYNGALASAHTRTGQSVVVIGAPDPFTNERLASRGNAALALGLLGEGDDVVWVMHQPAVGTVDQTSLFDILPRWVGPVMWELLLAGLLLALWRGRRLGPVVTEALPVVVRAAESVEGRARLYRRARARDRAADTLRSGARTRLVPFLGLGADPTPAALVTAVSSRSGLTPDEAGGLLYGPAPADDGELVHLADALDTLVRSTLDREGRHL